MNLFSFIAGAAGPVQMAQATAPKSDMAKMIAEIQEVLVMLGLDQFWLIIAVLYSVAGFRRLAGAITVDWHGLFQAVLPEKVRPFIGVKEANNESFNSGVLDWLTRIFAFISAFGFSLLFYWGDLLKANPAISTISYGVGSVLIFYVLKYFGIAQKIGLCKKPEPKG